MNKLLLIIDSLYACIPVRMKLLNMCDTNYKRLKGMDVHGM